MRGIPQYMDYMFTIYGDRQGMLSVLMHQLLEQVLMTGQA